MLMSDDSTIIVLQFEVKGFLKFQAYFNFCTKKII